MRRAQSSPTIGEGRSPRRRTMQHHDKYREINYFPRFFPKEVIYSYNYILGKGEQSDILRSAVRVSKLTLILTGIKHQDGELLTLNRFYHGGQWFILAGIDTSFESEFVCPIHRAWHHYSRVYGVFNLLTWHPVIPWDQGTHFKIEKRKEWAYAYGIHWSYHIL